MLGVNRVLTLATLALALVMSRARIHQRAPVVITPGNGGTWGDWGVSEYCPDGSFASGFEIKVEAPTKSDDTAMNGIKLYCRDAADAMTGVVTSTVQQWGEWRGEHECRSGFLVGFKLRVEPPQGAGDDTAANDMEMMCENGAVLSGGGDTWGNWDVWQKCPAGYAVCGLQTRVEEDQGVGDDSALNSVDMFCCNQS